VTQVCDEVLGAIPTKKKGNRGKRKGTWRGEENNTALITWKPEAVSMVAEAIAYPRPRLSWQNTARKERRAGNREGTERSGH
jgi:hypothetical protein